MGNYSDRFSVWLYDTEIDRLAHDGWPFEKVHFADVLFNMHLYQ